VRIECIRPRIPLETIRRRRHASGAPGSQAIGQAETQQALGKPLDTARFQAKYRWRFDYGVRTERVRHDDLLTFGNGTREEIICSTQTMKVQRSTE
jgi:hypothetical protein